MAESRNSYYNHSSGQRPSVSSSSSSTDPPILDGSFLLQLLQRKPHETSLTSSSDAGFPLLPHNLSSRPKPSHHSSPLDGGNQFLSGGQQFFHSEHERLGFPRSGVSPANFGPVNGNRDGISSSNQDNRASMRPPPGFVKEVFDGPARFNRKVEGGGRSQIGSDGYNQQWRADGRLEWRPSHYEEGRNSAVKVMDKSHLHNDLVERPNEKRNLGKMVDGDARFRRSDGFVNYKEKQVYSDLSGITSLNKCDFMGEKVDGKYDRNLEDYDDEKQMNRILEVALHAEIRDVSSTEVNGIEEDLLCKQLTSALRDSLDFGKLTKLGKSRDKDFRSDSSRGHQVSSQRVRIRRRELRLRFNIDNFSSSFLHIFKSLVPSDDEITKQQQLLFSLKKLVNKEWPDAELHLYGSCANSFGVSNSDIDICLAIKDYEISKLDILLKLADILESNNLLNVQALTRARVPIVKMMDPVTGISCDICINNLLAVVNTKLLKDYAQIDERLRQLAFIVKHWAKSRRVNETYHGTLSSYAYVLMCIYFLQTRDPPILPCLQGMEVTHKVIVEDTECAYFDQVAKLRNFGARNKESIAQLLCAFFHYWAYCHDYTRDVISVRTGSIISKQAKDWTRRIGNDRHLICIEDPFEVTHDLGRVVDKFSIKILREEFERAAEILQYDSNPTVTLFEPYIPPASST